MVANVLSRPTLVLNRSWQPVAISTVARSLTKAFIGSARIVDPTDYQLYTWADWAKLDPVEDELVIRSQHLHMRVPEVITLVNYDRLPKQTVAFNRRNLFTRDRFTCQYCGAQPGTEELTIDHVVPRAQGGISDWDNCVLACVNCNRRKADRTPQQAHMPLAKPPKRPSWKPLYAAKHVRIESWSRFVSEAYWNVELSD